MNQDKIKRAGVLCAIKVGHTQLMAAQVPPCGGQAENGLVPLPVPPGIGRGTEDEGVNTKERRG